MTAFHEAPGVGDRASVLSLLKRDGMFDPARDAADSDRPWGDRMPAAVLRDALDDVPDGSPRAAGG